MKKKWIFLAAVTLTVALSGCGIIRRAEERPPKATTGAAQTEAEPAAVSTAEPTVPATVPADGDPNDVTCKGSYTASGSSAKSVAFAGDGELTVGQLQGYYWAEAAQYRRDHEDGPDWDEPLDRQPCGISSEVRSWQQYFLQEALDAWHTAQALIQHSLDTPIQTEEAYQPNQEDHAKYIVDIPATEFLYGYSEKYRRNTMHQAYLDGLGETLDVLAGEKGYPSSADMAQAAFGTSLEDLTAYAEHYNEGYMYLTELSYEIQPSEDEIAAYFDAHASQMRDSGITKDSGNYVDVRHMLLIPGSEENSGAVSIGSDGKVSCTEEQWEACLQQAQGVLTRWKNKERGTEASFADIAHKTSQDTGTALDGGSLRRITKGQLIPELDSWCFDSGREPGDVQILRTDYGVCILYFSGTTPIWYAEAEDALKAEQLEALMEQIRQQYPMRVDYSAITLAPAEAAVAAGDILYPDVAHERYPEVPLYLQQDYPNTKFGGSPIRSHGCGITTMAMLATYMSDEPMTPPVMCARYGNYSTEGTNGMIFLYEPPAMGFYCLRRSYEPADVLEELKKGYMAVSVHSSGYWTRAGHYILIEKLNEDGTVQVRDSNLFNYNNSYRPAQNGHLVDKHSWASVVGSTQGFWIFDYKVTRIPVCCRCGDIGQTNSHILTQDYVCEKCRPALLRRNTYVNQ